MNEKKRAAEKAVELLKDNMTVGLGSGSTASFAIQKIGERIQHGLKIKAVASSVKSENLARACAIPVLDPTQVETIDLTIDGADEVDSEANLTKGGGGSLLREKIIAFASERFYVVIDESKLVADLGTRPLPVEVIPFAANLTIRHLRALGCDPLLRKSNGVDFITDNGNVIVDCKFPKIEDPAWLDVKIKMIPGVIETGLFPSKVVTSLFVGFKNGDVREMSINP